MGGGGNLRHTTYSRNLVYIMYFYDYLKLKFKENLGGGGGTHTKGGISPLPPSPLYETLLVYNLLL